MSIYRKTTRKSRNYAEYLDKSRFFSIIKSLRLHLTTYYSCRNFAADSSTLAEFALPPHGS